MSCVFVTGGAGYVGSHGVMALAAAGYDVVVYDDLSVGRRAVVDVLARAWPGRSIRLVAGDVCDRTALGRALGDSGATAVCHFAAKASVAMSLLDPAGYHRTNVEGSLAVLDAMVQRGIKHFVFSSTAATFGEPAWIPIDETHPQTPVNPYGETKLAVERSLPPLERAHGLHAVTLRYFNAAGADPSGLIGEDHDPEEHLIPLALEAAMGQRRLTVCGSDYPTPDGTCIRDFVHVSDLARAHVLALRRLEAGGGSASYNLGSGRGLSIREVLAAVTRVTGRPVPDDVGPRRAGDPARLIASSALIERELGWSPAFRDIDAIVDTAWRWRCRRAGVAAMSEPT